jgi:hypothetical protein
LVIRAIYWILYAHSDIVKHAFKKGFATGLFARQRILFGAHHQMTVDPIDHSSVHVIRPVLATSIVAITITLPKGAQLQQAVRLVDDVLWTWNGDLLHFSRFTFNMVRPRVPMVGEQQSFR